MRLSIYSQYYEIVKNNPGLRMSEYSKLCGVARSVFMRVLPSLEEFGFLLMEDDNRLFPYKVIRRFPEDLHDERKSRWTRWRRQKL